MRAPLRGSRLGRSTPRYSASAIADEAARLLLTDPAEYPIERLIAHADWLLA